MSLSKKFLLIFLSTFTLALFSCSKEDEDTKNVKVTLVPENPIVIEAPFTYSVGAGDEKQEIEVDGPWYQSRLVIVNGTNQILTVVAVVHRVEAFGEDGEIKEVVNEFGSDLLLVNNDDDDGNDQYYLFEIGPSETLDSPVVYYSGGLPDKENDQVTSYNYTVSMEIQGWFGPNTAPQKSFKKRLFFNTRE